MIEYSMCYAKPEDILKFVHNRDFNRKNNQHLTVIILVYDGCFKFVIEEQTNSS